MPFLKLFILSIVLVLIALLGLSVRLIFTKKGEFHGGSCSNSSQRLKDQGIGCGCGGDSCS